MSGVERPTYDARHEFFVGRHVLILDSQSTLVTEGNYEIRDKNVFRGGRRLTFSHEPTQEWRDLESPLWRVHVKAGLTRSNIVMDFFVNVAELATYVRDGKRFHGRKMLYSQVMSQPYHDHRIPNSVFANSYRTIESDFRTDLQKAFDTVRLTLTPAWTPAGNRLKTELFPFQRRAVAKMYGLETDGMRIRDVAAKYHLIGSEDHQVWMTCDDRLHLVDECEHLDLCFKGGIVSDEMGMGKTLTLLALCDTSPLVREDLACLRPRATLVLCPAQVAMHWVNEIKKHTKMKSITVTTKTQFRALTVGRMFTDEIDFVIMSFNALSNPVFKHEMDYYSSYNKPEALRHEFNRHSRQQRMDHGFNPHLFNWGRVILDEYHELGSYPKIIPHILSLRAESKWLVSGTPLVDSCLFSQFIPRFFFGDLTNIPLHDAMVAVVVETSIRSQNYEVGIPEIRETVIRIDLNKSERFIYDSIRDEGREQQLKVCAYPRLAKLFENTTVESLQEMKARTRQHLEEKIAHHKATIAQLDVKIAALETVVDDTERSREGHTLSILKANQGYWAGNLIKLQGTLQYVNHTEQTECVICYDELGSGPSQAIPCTLKDCGHSMCEPCTKKALAHANGSYTGAKCPVCRTSFRVQDTIKLCQDENPTLAQFGSKLYNLMKLLDDTKEVKTLIFSQWDGLLREVGKCLAVHGKEVLFCRGNVTQKDNAIRRFHEPNNNLLLLSTLNSGSGCDLSIATRVILLDTVDGQGTLISGKERQAIARCHRIGQRDSVQVVRLIARNTIEEEIYQAHH